MNESKEKENGHNWKPLLRQLLICSGSWNCYFMLGFAYGTPTVLIPQLRKENITVSPEMASWLPASITYSGFPWVFLLPISAYLIGRKKSHFLVSISSFIGFIIFYNSYDVISILVSVLFQGPNAASYLTTSVITVTEYSSARYRGFFLTLKSASLSWGILVANALGTFLHWRVMGIVGITCACYNLVTVFFWPESPYWLASKRRFQDCIDSHRWIKGRNLKSEEELEKLLKAHENLSFISEKMTAKKIIRTLTNRSFWKPVKYATLLCCLYCFSGKMLCAVFAVDILKNITHGDSTAYTSMLILDAVTVGSMYIGCLISKVLKRKTMLLIFSSVGVAFLFSISIYLFLVQSSVFEHNVYISVTLLTGYSVAIGSGPMILSTSIIGELLPIESKSLSMCVIALVFKSIFGTFLKLSPYCFQYLRMSGTFMMYALSSVVSMVLIYIYVPETKDKTLQEIDEEVRNKDDIKAGADIEVSESMLRSLDSLNKWSPRGRC